MPRRYYWLRIRRYCRSQGVARTILRISQKAFGQVFHRWEVVYCVELMKGSHEKSELPQNMSVEVLSKSENVPTKMIKAFSRYHCGEILRNEMERRFPEGANLWLLKVEGVIVGYIWSIVQNTIKPYYWPLTPNDVHLFDNEIFPEYRGQGLNAVLLEYVLVRLRQEGFVRAFIEANLTNKAQRRSLKKTAFTEICRSIKLKIGPWRISVFR